MILKKQSYEDLKKIDEQLRKLKMEDPSLEIPDLPEVKITPGVGGGVYMSIGLQKPRSKRS